MNTTTLQPVRPQDVEDWVYIAAESDDEPSIYETETTWHSQPIQHIDVLFKSDAAVEEPYSDAQTEPHIYADENDEDIIEDRVPPETAFELFLARNFPISDKSLARHDFSGSIYHEEQTTTKTSQGLPLLKKGLPGAESRDERLQRLMHEVEGLANEVGLNPSENAAAETLVQVNQLRQQLIDINLHCSLPASTAFSKIHPSLPLSLSTEKNVNKGSGKDSEDIAGGETDNNNIKLISPSLSTVYALERRVASLESSVNVHDLERTFDGQSIADVLHDVKTRLAFATDPKLSSRLCEDAQRIASILSKSDLSDTLRLGSLLDKMYEWQPIIDDLPIIIDRLTCVRHLHEEAAHFVESASKLSKLLDQLDSRASQNRSLLNTVRTTLQSNMETVNQNLDSLLRKIDHMDEPHSQPSLQHTEQQPGQQAPQGDEAAQTTEQLGEKEHVGSDKK